jgi:DNA modification methylase
MENNLLSPLEWRTEKRRVKDLIPFEFNPRKLSEERKQLLIKSLEKFNLAEIPAVNTDDVIIAGHQRVKVMLEIGRGEEMIDVRVPSRALNEEEFKEYNLVSNIPVGFWDVDLLEEHFQDVDLDVLNIVLADAELAGEALKDDFGNEEEQDFDPTPPKDPITKLGDVYEFISVQKGITHRLVCGDSCLIDTYNRLESDSCDMMLTDPPYNVNVEGGTSKKLTIKNDHMKSDQFYQFLFDFYKSAHSKLKSGSPVYVFHADSEGVNFRKAMTDAGFKLSQCLIWLKNSIVLSRHDYHWKHEPCLQGLKSIDAESESVMEHDPVLYGWKTGAAHPWFSDRKQSTILEFKRPTRSDEHPTMKPVDMLCYLIKNSSMQKNKILDPFGGSGSTLIACEMFWRQARMIELGEEYADVHVKRYTKYMRDNGLKYQILKNGQELTNDDLDKYFEE